MKIIKEPRSLFQKSNNSLSVQLQFKTGLAVGHSQFFALGAAGIAAFAQEKSVIFDVKSILVLGAADGWLVISLL